MKTRKNHFQGTIYWIKTRQSYKKNQIEKADYLFLLGLFETDQLTCISGLKYDDWFLDWIRE